MRCLRLYCCEATDVDENRVCKTWSERRTVLLLNSLSSATVHSSSKVGRSGRQERCWLHYIPLPPTASKIPIVQLEVVLLRPLLYIGYFDVMRSLVTYCNYEVCVISKFT